MKNTSFYLLIIFYIYFFSGCSEVIITENEKERILLAKNKVKSISEYVIIQHLGADENEHLYKLKLYNTKGLCINETLFYSGDSIEKICYYEYDNNNNLTLTKGLKPDSSIIFNETRIYDNKNNRKELYFYLPDGTYKYRNVATYDKEGKMLELCWFWVTGLSAKNIYKYEGSKKIENTEYNPDGKIQYKWIYKYDKNDNVIEEIQYYPDSIINCKIIREYNKENLLIKQTNYDRNSIMKTVTYKFDNNNLLILKTEYSSGGKISKKYKYQYNFF